TIAACVGAVSLKDEKCGDRKRKTPNRRAERIASLPVTRNRRRAAFSSQVLQRFPRGEDSHVERRQQARSGGFEERSVSGHGRCAALEAEHRPRRRRRIAGVEGE